MTKVNKKIKELRNELHLSQKYVANYLGISRLMYIQIENGNRMITADELSKLSTLFGVLPATIYTYCFDNDDDKDQAEIMNLIYFKEQIKKQRNR